MPRRHGPPRSPLQAPRANPSVSLIRSRPASRGVRHAARKLESMSDSDQILPCCLVVEDQALIGMALEASLEDAGFRIADPFGRAEEATAWLGRHTPDIALLDLVLGDGPCTRLATTLRERQVP